jgi:hypothetical protein
VTSRRRIGLAESFGLSDAEKAARRAERAAVSAAVEARRAELAAEAAAEAELWRMVVRKLRRRRGMKAPMSEAARWRRIREESNAIN